MNRNKRALTLVEISIGVVITSFILIALMNVFRAGMKGSSKGMAHQENMETASILMSQIEYDLMRSYSIAYPSNGSEEDGAKWDFYYGNSDSSKASVDYSFENNAIARKVTAYKADGTSGKVEKSYFAKNHKVDLKFLHTAFDVGTPKSPKKRHGMWVELTVSSKDNRNGGNDEPFTLKRLIVIRKNI